MVKVIPNAYKKFSFIFVPCPTWWELSQYLPNWKVVRQQQLEVGEGTSSEIQFGLSITYHTTHLIAVIHQKK